jgi:hypothetical protein
MQIQLQNTDQIVDINNGVSGRIWIGHTEHGVEVECVITRIAVRRDADNGQFERELRETAAPVHHVSEAIPLRMIL